MSLFTEADMRNRIFRSSLHWIGAVLCLFSAAWPADTAVQSRWAAEPFRIDGQTTEWSQHVMSLQKNLGVEYAISNDSANLYVLVVFRDPQYLSSIEMTGITLYFSPAGKKQKDVGVRFRRINATADELIGRLERQGQTLTEGKKAEIKAKPVYFLFEVDAINKKGEIIPLPEAEGGAEPPVFRLSKSAGGALVYEFRAPLASRNIHPAGVGSGPGESIKLGFEWGGMTKEMRAAAMSGEKGPDLSKVSTEDARGERNPDEGAAPSPSLARARQGPKQHSFWVDLKLAQAPTQ
jgi:hypothetical protein